MRILASTFRDGDHEKVLLAMRSLPYDKLVLVGGDDLEGGSLDRIRRLEQLSGNEVLVRRVDGAGFMDMVDSISESLAELDRGKDNGRRNEVVLNISGGSKILGDAALFAAFRLGIEAFHCDRVVVRLPVLKGATAKDRFTELQIRLLEVLGKGDMPFVNVLGAMLPNSRASSERTIRELRKMGLIRVRPETGVVLLGLSPEGAEVARATEFARGR